MTNQAEFADFSRNQQQVKSLQSLYLYIPFTYSFMSHLQDWRGNGGGKNFTFDNVRVKDIGRENEVLLQKLQRIAVKGSGATGGKVSGEAKRRESSQEINRRRKEQEIARQNLMIANRLQNAKSATFDRYGLENFRSFYSALDSNFALLSRKKMKDDQEMQEKYLRNASMYPVATTASAPKVRSRPSAPGRPPWFKELPKEDLTPIQRPQWQD